MDNLITGNIVLSIENIFENNKKEAVEEISTWLKESSNEVYKEMETKISQNDEIFIQLRDYVHNTRENVTDHLIQIKKTDKRLSVFREGMVGSRVEEKEHEQSNCEFDYDIAGLDIAETEKALSVLYSKGERERLELLFLDYCEAITDRLGEDSSDLFLLIEKLMCVLQFMTEKGLYGVDEIKYVFELEGSEESSFESIILTLTKKFTLMCERKQIIEKFANFLVNQKRSTKMCQSLIYRVNCLFYHNIMSFVKDKACVQEVRDYLINSSLNKELLWLEERDDSCSGLSALIKDLVNEFEHEKILLFFKENFQINESLKHILITKGMEERLDGLKQKFNNKTIKDEFKRVIDKELNKVSKKEERSLDDCVSLLYLFILTCIYTNTFTTEETGINQQISQYLDTLKEKHGILAVLNEFEHITRKNNLQRQKLEIYLHKFIKQTLLQQVSQEKLMSYRKMFPSVVVYEFIKLDLMHQNIDFKRL